MVDFADVTVDFDDVTTTIAVVFVCIIIMRF